MISFIYFFHILKGVFKKEMSKCIYNFIYRETKLLSCNFKISLERKYLSNGTEVIYIH